MATKTKKIELVLSIISITIISLLTFLLHLSAIKIVSVSYIPVRTTTDTAQQLSNIILKNEKYTVITRTREWEYIQFSNGHTGWINLNDKNTITANNLQNAQAVVATKSGVPVFKDTRSTDKELGKLDTQETYYKYFERNHWAQIVYNNQLVWVETTHLKQKNND